jgi:hypothetical protein
MPSIATASALNRGLRGRVCSINWPIGLRTCTFFSRVTSSLCLFCGLGLAQVVGNPALGKSVELLGLCRGVVFWRVVHLDPVDQIFLDPVVAAVGILLVDARDGLIEIEPFAIGPDKKTLPGVELHLLHHIAEDV